MRLGANNTKTFLFPFQTVCPSHKIPNRHFWQCWQYWQSPSFIIVPDMHTSQANLAFCQQHLPEMMSLLQRMVEMESPTDNKAAVDAVGAFMAQEFERIGGKVTFFSEKEAGNHLKAEFAGGSGKPALLLGHFDTVWSMGTLANMPFRIDNGRAFGPGIYDMKAGLAIALRVLEHVVSGRPVPRPIWVVFTADEE